MQFPNRKLLINITTIAELSINLKLKMENKFRLT